MPINFSNTNSVWASVLVETLQRLGLATAVVCPGSRSTPLTLALAQHPQIEAIPVLDERSAAFFALGLARQSGLPTVLVCTSGTAGANFYPAVIEARESRVPLLVLTADRPPELRECNAGQTVDQQKLYGTFPNWYSEVAVPSLDLAMLAYLRQTVIQAWERSRYPVPGPVHLNLPFRDPLAPVPQTEAQQLQALFPEDFFSFLSSPSSPVLSLPVLSLPMELPLQEWQSCTQGVIIAGPAQPQFPQPYCEAIAHLSQTLGWPVLAEALSPLRNYASLNPHLISTYDVIVRDPNLAAELAPAQVIRIGEMPTSKTLRTWLTQVQPRQWVIDPGDRNLDPLHGRTVHLRIAIEQISANLPVPAPVPAPVLNPYLKQWLEAEAVTRQAMDHILAQTDDLIESKAAWLLSQCLPSETPLWIANSMPVRDMEWFWRPGDLRIQPLFNRGANGIDGTLSTALGIAHRQASSVMLTGDLALLHDTNGFLLSRKLAGHLTIVLINNNGGGIFEMLAIAQFDPPFEEFFATPQDIDFAPLCQAYGVEYEQIQSWEQLRQRLMTLPDRGVRVLEIPTDRQRDTQWRRENLRKLAEICGKLTQGFDPASPPQP